MYYDGGAISRVFRDGVRGNTGGAVILYAVLSSAAIVHNTRPGRRRLLFVVRCLLLPSIYWRMLHYGIISKDMSSLYMTYCTYGVLSLLYGVALIHGNTCHKHFCSVYRDITDLRYMSDSHKIHFTFRVFETSQIGILHI